MGHSAGAVHVASYVSHPEFHKVKGGGLAGAIMVSGIYDLTASPVGDAEIAYFGADPARYAERSALQGLLATKIPLMIAAAELDPPRFVEQFELLKQAACKRASGCARALHAAAAQPYVGGLFDQHLRYPADRPDSRFRQDREIAAALLLARHHQRLRKNGRWMLCSIRQERMFTEGVETRRKHALPLAPNA